MADEWPERKLCFLNRLFFMYMWEILIKGYRKTIEFSDLWEVDESEKAAKSFGDLNLRYERFKKDTKGDEAIGPLTKSIFYTHWKSLLISLSLIIIRDILTFIIVLDLKQIIDLASVPEIPIWRSLLYVALIFFCQMGRSLLWQNKEYLVNKIGIRMRSALSSCVLIKALRLSPDSRRKFSPGAITNLASLDASQFLTSANRLDVLLATPILVIGSSYVLYDTIGHAFWPGVAVIGCVIVINSACGKYFNTFYARQLVKKDERLRLMSEILKLIKVAKLYAWELAFEKILRQIRKEEVSALRCLYVVYGINDIMWFTSAITAIVITFATYTIAFGNLLTPQIAFTVILVFSFPLSRLIMVHRAVLAAITISRSFKRLEAFMAAEELDLYVNHCETEFAVTIESGQFTWDRSTTQLKNININIEEGKLIAIVGQVGSGKSTLLNAITGETYKIGGHVQVKGTVAHVSQQSWILNKTLRENILLNKLYDKDRYDKILAACALLPDLETLPAGDVTEIGERGINLSGGQKQRVSLARALYQDCDIYLLDDPLSAVDIHVQKHLFRDVIGPRGLLKDKTRVLVTHALAYLRLCDRVIVMEGGQTMKIGDKDILTKSPYLNNIIDENFQKEAQYEPQTKGNSYLNNGKLIQEESVEVGRVPWSAYCSYIKSAGCAFGFCIFFSLFIFSSRTYAYILIQQWTDQISLNVTGKNNSDHQEMIILSGLVISQVLIGLIYSLLFVHFSTRASSLIHSYALRRLLRAPFAFFNTTPMGRIINRFGQDLNVVDNTIPSTLMVTIQLSILLILNVIPSIYATPISAILVIIIAIIFFYLLNFYIKSARQFQRLEAVSRSPIYSRLHDVVQGPEHIRVYHKQKECSIAYDEALDKNSSAQLCLFAATRWIVVNMNFLGNLICTGVALLAVLTPNLTSGLIGLSISAVIGIVDNFHICVFHFCETETAFVAMERLGDYMHIPQEGNWDDSEGANEPKVDRNQLAQRLKKGKTKVYDQREALKNIKLSSKEKPIETFRPSVYQTNQRQIIWRYLSDWPRTGDIEFIDYSLSYRPDLPLVLKNINFKIKGGEKIGIVGRTGAGKTSLTFGLFRLVEPTQGKIFIDSVDISTIGLCKLRKSLSVIPQGPAVFSGTIRENLDPFSEYDDSRIWAALEMSYLKNHVASFPNRLDQKLDDGGSNLSVGQRQLLCLARALLKRPKILVLDEATSSIDIETDTLVQATLKSVFVDCTVIAIAHRLETIIDYDRILVLDNGRVSDFGSVQQLLSVGSGAFLDLAKEAGIIA